MKMIVFLPILNVAPYIGLLVQEGCRKAGMGHAAFTTRASSSVH